MRPAAARLFLELVEFFVVVFVFASRRFSEVE